MKHSIYEETPLIPYLIAEKVAGQDANAVSYLEKRAERHYDNSLHFRQMLNKKGTDCRETLETFMGHWLMAYNKFKQLK